MTKRHPHVTPFSYYYFLLLFSSFFLPPERRRNPEEGVRRTDCLEPGQCTRSMSALSGAVEETRR